MDMDFVQLIVTQAPNLLGLGILAFVLVRINDRHDQREDKLLEWCLKRPCNSEQFENVSQRLDDIERQLPSLSPPRQPTNI